MREAAEETGLRVTNLARGPFTNDLFAAEGRHYVTLYVIADAPEGEAGGARAGEMRGVALVRVGRAAGTALPADREPEGAGLPAATGGLSDTDLACSP